MATFYRARKEGKQVVSELHSKEFKLDEKIQEIINEGLRYIEEYADLPFEQARRVKGDIVW